MLNAQETLVGYGIFLGRTTKVIGLDMLGRGGGGGSIFKHSSGVDNLWQGQKPGPEQCGINSDLGGR